MKKFMFLFVLVSLFIGSWSCTNEGFDGTVESNTIDSLTIEKFETAYTLQSNVITSLTSRNALLRSQSTQRDSLIVDLITEVGRINTHNLVPKTTVEETLVSLKEKIDILSEELKDIKSFEEVTQEHFQKYRTYDNLLGQYQVLNQIKTNF